MPLVDQSPFAIDICPKAENRRVAPIICGYLEDNMHNKAWGVHINDSYDSEEVSLEPVLRLNCTIRSMDVSSIPLEMKFRKFYSYTPLVSHGIPSAPWWLSRILPWEFRYGYDFHENWCTHMAHLALWNVTKSRIDPDKPDYIFDTNCCMNTVAFCDEDAPLVAGGTVSGELVIWSLSTENGSRVATCGCVEGGHQDSITGIFWLSRKSLNAYVSNLTVEYHLVTVGADGRIICWNLQRDRAAVFTLNYQVTGKDQSSRLQQDVYTCDNCDESLGSDGGMWSVGISTAAFSPHSTEASFPLFLLGTESGGLLVAHLETLDWTAFSSDSVYSNTLKSPVKYVLARYFAPIHCVAWSFSHRNLVAASGAFLGVHIYNILDRTRLYTLATEEGQIFTLHFLRSPPSRGYQHRSLLAYGSARGTVAIYDLCCNGDVSGDTTESEDFAPIKRCVLQCHKEMCTANPVICMASTDSVNPLTAVGTKNGTFAIFDTSNFYSLGHSDDTS